MSSYSVTDMQLATPVQPKPTLRKFPVRGSVRMFGGQVTPVGYFEMMRGDRLSAGTRFNISVKMEPTVEQLKNPVHVCAKMYFVPKLSQERFAGMDEYNASFAGQALREGDDVIPYFEKHAFDGSIAVYDLLGIHWNDGADINTDLLEAYNEIIRFQRSFIPDLSGDNFTRAFDDPELAACFWRDREMASILPTFDRNMIDGEVQLETGQSNITIPGQTAYVEGIAKGGNSSVASQYSDTPAVSGTIKSLVGDNSSTPQVVLADAVASLAGGGLTMKLSDLETAKKIVAIARKRKQYKHIPEEYMIDMLMDGYHIPSQVQSQPMLLDKQSTIIGMQVRHAMDAGNLDQKIAQGFTGVTLQAATPPVPTDGIVMIVVEIVPDRLHEKRTDPYLAADTRDDLPRLQRDHLNDLKVDEVKNVHINAYHSAPDTMFGFEPMNAKWTRPRTFLGGRYKATADGTHNAERNHFWTPDYVDPVFDEKWLLAGGLQHDIFDYNGFEPFMVEIVGQASMLGFTQFGPALMHDTDDYERIAELANSTDEEEEEEVIE